MPHAQIAKDVVLNPISEGDLYMLYLGAYAPLQTFCSEKDYFSILHRMRLPCGGLWPVPIVLSFPTKEEAASAHVFLLKNKQEQLLATLHVSSRFERDLTQEARVVYGTTSTEHPGVAALFASGSHAVTGKLEFNTALNETFLNTETARNICSSYGWKRVVGFQTRNPIHKAHAYLIKCALESCDGLLLQPLAGHTLDTDIPFAVRMQCYEAFINNHLPNQRALLAPLPAPMRYAGPKEAVLHALIRRNYGCTHFIVGRDHAGVGSFYTTYAAQHIFDTLEEKDLSPMVVLRYENAFFCRLCGHMATSKTCPHDPSAHTELSGSAVRSFLENQKKLPDEFTYRDIADILYAWKNSPS